MPRLESILYRPALNEGQAESNCNGNMQTVTVWGMRNWAKGWLFTHCHSMQ